ncbi:two-component system regulatory protein YycI [Peribacillus cavernae]|uniref:two-component system regulatory protein YycI n=1 Tax=Peribacillus cavernae TaxID=1674310 RepID=UPI00163CBB10|nr:two-component system regulatory protein YycI [Peribacillus cavernae]MDQ0220968.1 regulatory protein YycI of two-component signal transduction system YycFG [Peribacillus cavernae]
MDWSKTKTIFIMVFLVLDIFLLFQFLQNRDANKFGLLSETSAEDQMKEEGITYPELPNEKIKESILLAKRKEFSKEDGKNLKNQQVILNEKNKLAATLEKPIIVSKDFDPNELAGFLKENIYEGENYEFWSFDKKTNTIVYYQRFGTRVFYNNTNAKLTLLLNENGEVVSYEQTFLEDIKPMNKKEEVLPAIKAIETLYNNGDLPGKSRITKVKLGFYNLLKSSSASYLLTPTWWIEVNGKDMFVKAFDGEIIEPDTEEKIILE